MKILLIFTLCLMSDGGASNEVTGYSGGGVVIKCKYETRYKLNDKGFCKGSWPLCDNQIYTQTKNQWVTSGRFSLFDDPESAEFWVMIRKITVQDTGTYHCRVDIHLATDIYSLVKLMVKEAPFISRTVIAYAKTRSNIKCRYEDEYKDKAKFFSKIDTDQWRINQLLTEPKSLVAHDHRFSIQENRSAGFFSVFIRDLMTEDTGTYACGVVVSDTIEIYTVVELNVREDLSSQKSISKTVYIGGYLTVSCKYPECHRNDNKFLCKTTAVAACSYNLTVKESKKSVKNGIYSLYDDREKQIFTVSLENATDQDSGEYWCGAEVNWKSDSGYKVYFTQINVTVTGFPAVAVITVSVVLLLIGIIIFIVILYKKCKKKCASPKTTTQTSTQINRGYENGRNVLHVQPAQNTNQPKSANHNLKPQTNRSDSVYQSLDPNTKSDSIYQGLDPNTKQSDSIYQSLDPNTKQSDYIYQSLDPKTKSDSVYESLDPNTKQLNAFLCKVNQ